MFSAIKYNDVSKQQMVSAAKKFKLPSNVYNGSKDTMALELGKTFLKEKYVKFNVGQNLKDIRRENVKKLKVF